MADLPSPETLTGLPFGFGLSMSAMIVTMAGPDQNNKELQPQESGSGCSGADPPLTCMGATGIVNEEQAHGPFVVLLPGLYAGYAF